MTPSYTFKKRSKAHISWWFHSLAYSFKKYAQRGIDQKALPRKQWYMQKKRNKMVQFHLMITLSSSCHRISLVASNRQAIMCQSELFCTITGNNWPWMTKYWTRFTHLYLQMKIHSNKIIKPTICNWLLQNDLSSFFFFSKCNYLPRR